MNINNESLQRATGDKKNEMSKLIQDLNKVTYNSNLSYSDKMDLDVKEIDADINKLMNSQKEDRGADYLDAFTKEIMTNPQLKPFESNIKAIDKMIKSDKNLNNSLMMSASQKYQNKYNFYIDVQQLTTLLTQLDKAIETRVNNIMNGDNSESLAAIKADDNEVTYYKKINSLYDYEGELRDAIKGALMYGKRYVLVLSYAEAFYNLKKNYLKRNGVELPEYGQLQKESTISITEEDHPDYIEFKELLETATECYKYNNDFDDMENYQIEEKTNEFNDSMQLYLKEFIETIEITDDISSLSELSMLDESSLSDFCSSKKSILEEKTHMYLTEEEIKELNIKKENILKENEDFSFKKIFGSNISHISEKKHEDEFDELLHLKEDLIDPKKDFKNIGVDSVPGAIIKQLDITKVIPLEADDVTLGYYYIEGKGNIKNVNQAFQGNQYGMNPITQMMGGSATPSIFNLENNDNKNSDKFFKQLSNIVIKVICKDKKYLKDNEKFKEQIYGILKFGNLNGKKIKITYIDRSKIVEFGNGESILDKSVFFAKLYLALIVTNIMLKISRGYDTRMYYVNMGNSTKIGTHTQRAIRDLKNSNRSINDISSANNILGRSTEFRDLVVPLYDGGVKPIETDVISGQNVDMDNDFIKYLEERMLMNIVPLSMLEAQTEVDYAKSLDLVNNQFALDTLAGQKEFDEPASQLYNKIKCADLGISMYANDTELVKINFTPPRAIGIQNETENIENGTRLKESIVNTYIAEDDNDPQSSQIKLEFGKAIMRDLLPGVDWNKYDEIFTTVRDEVKEKIATDNTNKNDDGTESNF